MLRAVYALAVIVLIGGTAVTAKNIDRDSRPERGLAVLALAGMQR